MWPDLRDSIRALRVRPGLALLAILSLALGIGANATIFVFTNYLLLSPPPVSRPARVAEIWTHDPLPTAPFNGFVPLSFPDYQDVARQNQSFSGVAIYDPLVHANWQRGAQERSLYGQVVSGNYFRVLGLNPAPGRDFTAAESAGQAAAPAAVISHKFWQQVWGGDPDVIGKSLRLNGRDYPIVGVAPKGFSGLVAGGEANFWVPLGAAAPLGEAADQTRGDRRWFAVGRLQSGATPATASADLGLIARRLDAQYPRYEPANMGFRATPLGRVPYIFRQTVSGATALLTLLVALVLLIACANAANLLLVRAAGRRRELAIRGALGAGRGRLARQLLTESVLIALLAAVAGLLFADWLAPLFLRLAPPDFQVKADLSVGGAVIAFSVGLALLTGLATGLIPAWRGAREDLVAGLKQGSARSGHARSRLRGALVVGEVAVCAIVLIGAGLCLRSLGRARRINPGFDAAHLAVVQDINLSALGYHEGPRALAFSQKLTREAAGLPGVEAASWVSALPLGLSESDTEITVPGYQPEAGMAGFSVQLDWIAPDYFRAMGTRLLAGRAFTAADIPRGDQLVVVNQAFADRFWPRQDAVGRTLTFVDHGRPVAATIIGVAPTGKYRSLGEAPRPFLFRLETGPEQGTLVVRATGDPRALLGPLRRLMAGEDPGYPITGIETGTEYMASPLLAARLSAILLGGFAALALVLAVLGLYGVISYSVSQRAREFGIRLALGAAPDHLARSVLLQGARLGLWGVAIGGAAAWGMMRLLTAILYGVSPGDPLTFLAVACVLIAVTAVASLAPALRAARSDPLTALRAE